MVWPQAGQRTKDCGGVRDGGASAASALEAGWEASEVGAAASSWRRMAASRWRRPGLKKPYLRVTVLTLGAEAVAAGMVQVAGLAAVGALVDLSAQGGCATLLDGPHCLVMAGQHVRAEAGAIGRAIAPEDLGEFYHARRLTTCSMIWAACSFASTVRWV